MRDAVEITQEQHDAWLAAMQTCPTVDKFSRLHGNIQTAINSNNSNNNSNNSDNSLWHQKGSLKRIRAVSKEWLTNCVINNKQPLEGISEPLENTLENTLEMTLEPEEPVERETAIVEKPMVEGTTMFTATDGAGGITSLTYDELVVRFALADLVLDTGLVTQGCSLKTAR